MPYGILAESTKKEVMKIIKENINLPSRNLSMIIQENIRVSISDRAITLLKRRVRK